MEIVIVIVFVTGGLVSLTVYFSVKKIKSLYENLYKRDETCYLKKDLGLYDLEIKVNKLVFDSRELTSEVHKLKNSKDGK